MAKKDMTIKIAADQVMFSNISRSKDGYNSARVVVKIADNEYMSVSYEWEGSSIPDFAMNLMGFMQANNIESGTVYEDDEYACKTCKEHNPELFDKDGKPKKTGKKKAASSDDDAAKKGKKGVNPFIKKKDEEEEDPKDKKKDDKKKDKKKAKK